MQELKICVYNSGGEDRIGSLVDDEVYDLNLCYVQQLATEKSLEAYRLANSLVPTKLEAFLTADSGILDRARNALKWVIENNVKMGPAGESISFSVNNISLKAPIIPSTKVVCIGGSYMTHIDIAGTAPHDFPVPFYKMSQVVVGPDDWVVLPKHHYPEEPVVYDTELTIVIGSRGRSVSAEKAKEMIWGYTILNDVTLRGARASRGPIHKVFDSSAPVGPCIVPKDQISDPHNLTLELRINGKTVQKGNTSNLIEPIYALIAEVSKWVTLDAGDIIATGGPGATEHLKPDDVMEAEVENIGVLSNPVRLED